jgi:ABC-type ATPase involved in cell division
MLKYCLVLNEVTLPGPAGMWSAPLNLALELQEVLLVENISPEASVPLLEVAASLRPPASGQAWHWDQEAFSLPRGERYRLRRRIAYLAPDQVLLSRLTLGENIALGTCYQEGIPTRTVLSGHADLLEHLGLKPYLKLMPDEVEEEVGFQVLWAREMIKQPELIVAVLGEAWEPHPPAQEAVSLLKDYLARRSGAALLLGQSLHDFHPLASRLLRQEGGGLLPQPLSEHQGRPLTDFLSLVVQED